MVKGLISSINDDSKILSTAKGLAEKALELEAKIYVAQTHLKSLKEMRETMVSGVISTCVNGVQQTILDSDTEEG